MTCGASTRYLPQQTAAHFWFPVDGTGHWQGSDAPLRYHSIII
jgi:hypothetical protein